MTDTKSSQRDAVREIESYSAADILVRERAQELTAPFDIELEDDRFQPLENITPVMHDDNGDTGGISATELVIEIVVRVGMTPEKPVYDGYGFTARARFEQNLSKLYDHVNMEYSDL